MQSLYCAALDFIRKNKEYNPEKNVPNRRYLTNVILQEVFKQ